MTSWACVFKTILTTSVHQVKQKFCMEKSNTTFFPSHSSKSGNTDDSRPENQFSNIVMFSFYIWQSKINTELLKPGSSHAFFLNAADQVRFPIYISRSWIKYYLNLCILKIENNNREGGKWITISGWCWCHRPSEGGLWKHQNTWLNYSFAIKASFSIILYIILTVKMSSGCYSHYSYEHQSLKQYFPQQMS